MSITKLNQIRDINGYITQENNGLPFSLENQYFTLTVSTVKSVTVPSGNTKSYTAYFEYSDGADVWVLPASSPTLTAPSGTVTATLAQLNPKVRTVLPGQSIQILYANTDSGVTTVSVGISYYANGDI